VLSFVLDVYQRQRPARLKWWAAYYDDEPGDLLPDTQTTADLRPILWLSEIRIRQLDDLGVGIALQFDCAFDRQGIGVMLRDNEPTHAAQNREIEEDRGENIETITHPILGTLRDDDGRWRGDYATLLLHGDHDAGSHRWAAEQYGGDKQFRDAPDWDVLENRYPLHIDPEQEVAVAAWQAFMQDQEAHERQVLAAIANVMRDMRDDYTDGWDDRQKALMYPPIERDEDALNVVTFGGPSVIASDDGNSAGIVFTFYWDNEHPLGVCWRNGLVIYEGDADSAEDAARDDNAA
jgi:hypothetical protein